MAMQCPKVYYGLHFVPGVAEYQSADDRIYISEQTAKTMDSSFAGKPVYVGHVDKVNLENIQQEADGYVVESFFNPFDGKHWAKFIIVSDAGHKAIQDGWSLSNAYTVTEEGPAGKNHNVDYAYEVLDGTYTHLAVVQMPRYEESKIMAPELFKEYNDKKEAELKELKNSLEEKKNKLITNTKKEIMSFKFFAKKEIENANDVENSVVVLKNGKEMSVKGLVELANKMNDDEEKKKEEEEKKAKEEAEKKNSDDADADDKKKAEEEKAKKEKEEKEAEEKKANELKEEEKKNKLNEIKNAMDAVEKGANVDLCHNQIARGQRLYGSNK